MYFSGKTYFNPTIHRELQVVRDTDTRLNKPKSRKKGKLTRKKKAKKVNRLAKLKKELGNDMVLKLLIRLLEKGGTGRPVGRPPLVPQTSARQPRKMRLSRGSGLPAREKKKLEKQRPQESKEDFSKRVEEHLLEHNPAFVYFNQLLQTDRERGNAVIKSYIDELKETKVKRKRPVVRERQVPISFHHQFLREIDEKPYVADRKKVVKKFVKEARDSGFPLKSSDEDIYAELAQASKGTKRSELRSRVGDRFLTKGRLRLGKEYIGEEEYEESLFDIAGETPFEKARQQLEEAQAAATTGGETTGGESGSTLFQERLGVLSPTTQRERDILLGRHATATAQKVAKKYRPVGRPTHASKGRETKAEQQRRERGEAEAQQLRDMMGGTELPVDLPEGYTPATATKGQIVVQKAGGEPAPAEEPAPFLSAEEGETDVEERLRKTKAQRLFGELTIADTGEIELLKDRGQTETLPSTPRPASASTSPESVGRRIDTALAELDNEMMSVMLGTPSPVAPAEIVAKGIRLTKEKQEQQEGEYTEEEEEESLEELARKAEQEALAAQQKPKPAPQPEPEPQVKPPPTPKLPTTPPPKPKGQIVVQKAGGEPAPPPKPKSPHTEAQQIEQRILQVDTELATGASTGGMSFQAGKSKEELEEERQQLQIELQLKHEQAEPTTLQDVALQDLSQERLGISPKQRQATKKQIKAGKTHIPTYLTPPEPAGELTGELAGMELLANQQYHRQGLKPIAPLITAQELIEKAEGKEPKVKPPTTPQVREQELTDSFLEDIKALAPDDAPAGSRKAVAELEKNVGDMVQRQIETDKYYSHLDLTDRISKGFEEQAEIIDALEKGGLIQLAYKRNNKNSKALDELYRKFDNNNMMLHSNKLLDEDERNEWEETFDTKLQKPNRDEKARRLFVEKAEIRQKALLKELEIHQGVQADNRRRIMAAEETLRQRYLDKVGTEYPETSAIKLSKLKGDSVENWRQIENLIVDDMLERKKIKPEQASALKKYFASGWKEGNFKRREQYLKGIEKSKKPTGRDDYQVGESGEIPYPNFWDGYMKAALAGIEREEGTLKVGAPKLTQEVLDAREQSNTAEIDRIIGEHISQLVDIYKEDEEVDASQIQARRKALEKIFESKKTQNNYGKAIRGTEKSFKSFVEVVKKGLTNHRPSVKAKKGTGRTMKQFIDKLKGNNDVSEFLKVSEDGFSVNPASLGFTENLQKVKYDEDKKHNLIIDSQGNNYILTAIQKLEGGFGGWKIEKISEDQKGNYTDKKGGKTIVSFD